VGAERRRRATGGDLLRWLGDRRLRDRRLGDGRARRPGGGRRRGGRGGGGRCRRGRALGGRGVRRWRGVRVVDLGAAEGRAEGATGRVPFGRGAGGAGLLRLRLGRVGAAPRKRRRQGGRRGPDGEHARRASGLIVGRACRHGEPLHVRTVLLLSPPLSALAR